jgi:hypothetical protein
MKNTGLYNEKTYFTLTGACGHAVNPGTIS